MVSVTTSVNHCGPSSGNGGGGINAQLMAGIVRMGPDVVLVIVFATPNDQSQAVMVPGEAKT